MLTVVGDDQAGLVAALATVVSALGGNWEQSRLAELAGKFAGVVSVAVPAERVDDLSAGLAEIDSSGLLHISVSPAAVSTGILDDFKRAFGDRVAQNLAKVGRAGLPSEIADVICFLAGPESHWIKGQDLVVDGGMSALAASEAMGL